MRPGRGGCPAAPCQLGMRPAESLAGAGMFLMPQPLPMGTAGKAQAGADLPLESVASVGLWMFVGPRAAGF